MENREKVIQANCSCSLINFNYKIHQIASTPGKSRILPKKSSSKLSQSSGKKSKISLSKSSSFLSGLIENQISVNESSSNQNSQSPAQKTPFEYQGSYKFFETHNNAYIPSQNKLKKKMKHIQTKTLNLDEKSKSDILERTKNTNTNFENSTVAYPNDKTFESTQNRMFDTISFSVNQDFKQDKKSKQKQKDKQKQPTKHSNQYRLNMQRVSKMQPVDQAKILQLYHNFAKSKILSSFLNAEDVRKIKTLKQLGYKQAESSGGGTSENHVSMVMSIEEVKPEELKGLDRLARKSSSFTKIPKISNTVFI